MKHTLIILAIFLVGVHFSINEWGTFENPNNGYKGVLITLDEPVRKVFEHFKIDEIEFPGKFLISFNTFNY